MADRLLQLVVREADVDAVSHCLSDLSTRDWWRVPCDPDDNRHVFFVALHAADEQDIIDRISSALDGRHDWRLFSLPTEANLPEIEDEEEAERLARKRTHNSREEIYADMRQGTALTVDYLLMTALATIVAAIGILSDQVAVVIGAMVIAPLLGPILAFAFATTLGNYDLLRIAARSLGAGLGLAIVVATGLGMLYGPSPGGSVNSLMDFSGALSLRTVALPLASGAAAALMVASGQTSALVGVMVAAALLPPLAAFGLLLGAADINDAMRALATVLTNIVAINLAAQVVFRIKGIRPRRWDSKSHAGSVPISIAVSALLVAAVALGLYLAGHGFVFNL